MFDSCLRCDYPLTGLPEDHACPECGLRYDRDSRVYRPAAGMTFFQTGASYVASIWFASQILRVLIHLPPAVRHVVLLAAVVGLLALSCFLWRRYGAGPARKFVAAMPDFLLLRNAGHLREIPWANISRISANRAMMGVTVFLKNTRTVETIAGFFRSKAEAFDLVSRANRRIQGTPSHSAMDQTDAAKPAGDDPRAVSIPLRMARDRSTRWFLVPLIFALMLGVFALPLPGKNRLVLLAGVIIASVVTEIVFAVRSPKIPQRIVIDRRGVTMFRGNETILELPWNEIRTVKVSRLGGTFAIVGDSGQTLFLCSTQQLARWETVNRVEAAIANGQTMYASEPG